MKKLLPLFATALLLSGVRSAFAQTADEVVEKSVAAMGGRAALMKIRSRSATGTIVLTTPAGEISGAIAIYNKAPN